MIEKIATHLADFSPRLQSNTRALYQVILHRSLKNNCLQSMSVLSFRNLPRSLLCVTTSLGDSSIQNCSTLLHLM